MLSLLLYFTFLHLYTSIHTESPPPRLTGHSPPHPLRAYKVFDYASTRLLERIDVKFDKNSWFPSRPAFKRSSVKHSTRNERHTS